MTDSDVEMLSEQFATMSATTYTTIDWAFHEIAENDDEYRRWHDQVHTCFCRSEDCVSCAVRDCEHHDPYHYHHDGCPSCHEALRGYLTPAGAWIPDDWTHPE